MAMGVKARLGVAADLVRDRLLCDYIVPDINRDIQALRSRGLHVYSPDQIGSHPKCILWYVLDSSGTVVIVPEKYRSYRGINLGSFFNRGISRTPLHYISLLSKRSVIGTAYPLEDNLTVIVERDLVDIIPTLRYFTTNPIFPQEVIFLLSGSGRAIYHPDKNVVNTRQNIAFDMKEKSLPDDNGFFTYRSMGRKYIAMSMTISAPPQWSIHYSLPVEVVYQILKDALLLHLSMLLVLIGFIFVLLRWLLNRVFSRPVRDIVKAVERRGIYHTGGLKPELAHGISELESILKAIESRDVAVAKAAEQLSAILNSIDAAVYVADMQTYDLLFVNDRIKEWAGDVKGKKCYEALQSGFTEPCPFCTNKMLVDENGRPSGVYRWEYENSVAGRWYECRDRAIPWTDGRLARIEISTDITWRKEAEKEIFNEKERLAVTLASIGDAVITTDIQGRISLMNPVAEKITGWSIHDARGKPFTEVIQLINERGSRQCFNPVELAMKTGSITPLEGNTNLVRRDGTSCSIADSAAPIFDRDRRIIGAVVVFRDITDELRTREELLKVKKLETVGVLAGGIAHDFNNIIAAIMGNIELAQFSLNPSEKAYRQLDNAIKACGRARDLAQQLLTFSKGGTPVRKRTSLPELIRESADFVLHGSNAACTYDFADNLWKADLDRGQMSQVIQNLVLNSIHAMPDGGNVRITCTNCTDEGLIATAGLQPGRYIAIEIKDTGIGIPKEIIDKIFEPYFSTKQTGSGLGLAIVHSIIAKHDGAILVDSKQGKGAVFTILIPAAYESGKIAGNNSGQGKTTMVSPATILIMDDDPMIRDLAADILKIYGHKTIEAEDGRQAVDIYIQRMKKGRPVDMVIMDLTVPGGMGGVETIQKLLEIDPDVTAVVASGYSNDPVMSDYRKYGFKGTLTKPYSMKEMGDIVVRLATGSRNRKN